MIKNKFLFLCLLLVAFIDLNVLPGGSIPLLIVRQRQMVAWRPAWPTVSAPQALYSSCLVFAIVIFTAIPDDPDTIFGLYFEFNFTAALIYWVFEVVNSARRRTFRGFVRLLSTLVRGHCAAGKCRRARACRCSRTAILRACPHVPLGLPRELLHEFPAELRWRLFLVRVPCLLACARARGRDATSVLQFCSDRWHAGRPVQVLHDHQGLRAGR